MKELKEERDRIFKEYFDTDGFVGASIREETIVVMWEDKKFITLIDTETDFEIIHQITGKIELQ